MSQKSSYCDIEYNDIKYEHENNVLYISYKEYSSYYKTIEQKISKLLIDNNILESEFGTTLAHVINMLRRNHSIAYSSTNKILISVRNYHVYYKVSIVIHWLLERIIIIMKTFLECLLLILMCVLFSTWIITGNVFALIGSLCFFVILTEIE